MPRRILSASLRPAVRRRRLRRPPLQLRGRRPERPLRGGRPRRGDKFSTTRIAPARHLVARAHGSIDNIANFFAARAARSFTPAKLDVPEPTGKTGLRQGSRVRHPKYGEGTVFRREGEGDDAKITVQFQQHRRKKAGGEVRPAGSSLEASRVQPRSKESTPTTSWQTPPASPTSSNARRSSAPPARRPPPQRQAHRPAWREQGQGQEGRTRQGKR